MRLVMQPTATTCDQAYIVMITGKEIEEVIKDMKQSIRIGYCYLTANIMTLNSDSLKENIPTVK